MYKFALLIILIIHCAIADDIDGACQQMAPMPYIGLSKFVGTWYGVQSGDNIPGCEIFKISTAGAPFTYSLNTLTKLETPEKKYQTITTETLKVIDFDQPGRMRIRPLPKTTDIGSFRISHAIDSNFVIVKTDYESYAVVYRSDAYLYYSAIDGLNREDCSRYTQIWSRTPGLSEHFKRKMVDLREQFGTLDSLLFNLEESKNKTGCLLKKDEFDNPLI